VKQMKVLTLGTAALIAGTLLLSETALADGFRNSHKSALHASGLSRSKGRVSRQPIGFRVVDARAQGASVA
jgi:hypothetical protein